MKKKISINVKGFSIEKKKRVQDAFFMLGYSWVYSTSEYRYLETSDKGRDIIGYTNTSSYGQVYDRLMYAESSLDSSFGLVSYDELMEMAGMNEDKDLTELLKDGVRVYVSAKGRGVFYVCGDDIISPSSGGKVDVKHYEKNLCHCTDERWNIEKLVDRDNTVLFQRRTKMTKTEIEEALGYKITIVEDS